MLIELKGITKAFKERKLFNEADMSVESGQMVALVGPSGNGKSTIMNILLGLVPLDRGRYLIDGENITNNYKLIDAARLKHMAAVPQGLLLLDQLTALENILIAAKAKGLTNTEEDIKAFATRLHIHEFLKKKVKLLSLGERQRIAIVRALITKPRFLLLDEPTSALNEELQIILLDILKKQAQSGTAILIITHDKAISENCNKIYSLVDGLLKQNRCDAEKLK